MRSRGARSFRFAIAAAIAVVVPLGLATRRYPRVFGAFLAEHAGDALYVTLGALVVALARPRTTAAGCALTAFAATCAVEASQRWDHPWLVAARRTAIGRLFLGTDFTWWDFPRYAVGALLGYAVVRAARRAA